LRRWNWLGVAAMLLVLALPVLGAEEGHGGGDTNIFNADFGNFLFTLVIFGLVVYILGKTAWRPVLNVLNERERTIRESLETAQREREAAQKLLDEYRQQRDRARQEASAIVDEGRKDADAVRHRIAEETRRETAEQTQRAKREIQLAKDTALKELYDLSAELSVDMAGRVLKKQLSPEDHRRLVGESLAAIRARGKASA
jgi:F-type H+-transporting ATPase subunit b